MAAPIRVLHIIHRLGDGGADHVLTRLVNRSDPGQFEHSIVTLGPGPGHEAMRAAVRVTEVPPGAAHALGVLTALGSSAIAGVDVVHGWVARASIAGASLAAALGAPLVLRQPTNMEFALRFEADDARTYWRELKAAYENAEAVIVPSPALVDVTRRICGVADPVVIPNAVDVDSSAAWHTPERRDRPFTLGFVGRLCDAKDPLTLIEALGLIGRAFDWRLTIWGEGNLRASMAARTAELGLADRVAFAGFERGWRDRTGELDAFVLPSRYEGMSNAILEAAAAGLPIIATAIPANEAVLTHKVEARLVSPNCAPALAEAIRQVAADPAGSAAMGARARRRARDFTIAAMVTAHENLYTRLAQPAAAVRAA